MHFSTVLTNLSLTWNLGFSTEGSLVKFWMAKIFRKKKVENKRFSKTKLEMKKANLMAFWFWFHFSRWFVLCHGFLVNCQKSQFFRQVGFPPMGYI
jgi:hypothetical protein